MKTDTSKLDSVVAAFKRLGGNKSAVARELGLPRTTVQSIIKKAGVDKKPMVGGTLLGISTTAVSLPPPGQIRRFICTSAQNNSKIHTKLWDNLLALAEWFGARILVGTYSYNKNAYGALSVKRGTKDEHQRELWYDERLTPYLADERIELGKGLVWCGEMNILPTASDPLSGLETYSHRKSAIFPHAKLAMRSIASVKGESTKLNYTTGTVTQRNYVQKKAGLVAEHHHTYGAVLVEVNSDGHWFVRQLDADDNGVIHDLDIRVENEQVIVGNRVEAITWGDIHATTLDSQVAELALGDEGMLETLRPKYQFVHDILEGVSVNHHASRDPHEQFKRMLRGFHVVEAELKSTAQVLRSFWRPWVQTVVVDSNHDNWLMRWLREHDYRSDPLNAEIFLAAQLEVYRSLREKDKEFHLIRWVMERFGAVRVARFLQADESFTICNRRIECGQHGHLGPDGARGTAKNLAKVGRRANVGHSHSACILDGLYQAGTSTTLDMGYNKGPSSWTHTHIVTYPNGKRTLITLFAGKWRA